MNTERAAESLLSGALSLVVVALGLCGLVGSAVGLVVSLLSPSRRAWPP